MEPGRRSFIRMALGLMGGAAALVAAGAAPAYATSTVNVIDSSCRLGSPSGCEGKSGCQQLWGGPGAVSSTPCGIFSPNGKFFLKANCSNDSPRVTCQVLVCVCNSGACSARCSCVHD